MSLWPEIALQEALETVRKNIADNHYAPLKKNHSIAVRQYYESQLCMPIKGRKCHIFAPDGILLATGYERVVIGDYGAYVEIAPENMLLQSIRIKPGQEWRLTDQYNYSKYHWLETIGSNIKVYYQQRPVSYADYKVGFYYVSPSEVQVVINS